MKPFEFPNKAIDGEVHNFAVLKNVDFSRVSTADVSAFGEDTVTEHRMSRWEKNTLDSSTETYQIIISNMDIIEHSIEGQKGNSEKCRDNMDIEESAESSRTQHGIVIEPLDEGHAHGNNFAERNLTSNEESTDSEKFPENSGGSKKKTVLEKKKKSV